VNKSLAKTKKFKLKNYLQPSSNASVANEFSNRYVRVVRQNVMGFMNSLIARRIAELL
jgi:hypothetical protein